MTPIANVACEQHEGRYRWLLLRFTGQGATTNYVYGPPDEQHRMTWPHFASQRLHMLRVGDRHVRRIQHDPLTPERIVDPLREAISMS